MEQAVSLSDDLSGRWPRVLSASNCTFTAFTSNYFLKVELYLIFRQVREKPGAVLLAINRSRI